MGGNALKHLHPQRMTSMEVVSIFWRVFSLANALRIRVFLVPWCLDKNDHGDIDVIVEAASTGPQSSHNLALLADAVGDYNQSVKNGPVISVAYPWKKGVVQLDLISTKREDLSHTLLYYSGGGLGMILGRVAAAYGLVFASEGLRLRSDPEKPWSRDIPLTSDPIFSLEALGYDWHGVGGFENEEQLWRFALNSPKAEPWMFLPELTNADNRYRDRGRPSYMRFQDWLRKNYDVTARPRSLREEGMTIARRLVPDIDMQLIKEESEWRLNKGYNYDVGIGAVKHHFPDMLDAEAGEIVRLMQPLLPSREMRTEMFRRDDLRQLLVQMARNAALVVCTRDKLTQP